LCLGLWAYHLIIIELIGNLIILFATLFTVTERNSSGGGNDPGSSISSYGLQVQTTRQAIVLVFCCIGDSGTELDCENDL